MDVASLLVAFFSGYVIRSFVPILSVPDSPPSFRPYVPITIVYTLSVMFIFYFALMYHRRRAATRFDVVSSIIQNVSIGTVTAVAIETLAFKNSAYQFDYPRGVILYTWFFSIVYITIGREFYSLFVYFLQRRDIARDNVLVVGESDVARSIIKHIRTDENLGYNLVGAVTESGEGRVAKVDVIGNIGALPPLIDTYLVDQVIVAIPEATRKELVYLVSLCQRGQVDIKIYPDNFAFIAGTLTMDDIVGVPLLSVRDVALHGWKLSLKRAVDIAGAIFGLIFLSPVMMMISFLVWRQDHGPVFFTQERVGLDGRPFPMIKFRTMITDAEEHAQWTTENDSRVTPFGHFLRQNNLDELPQFINVLYGQMSLVGPRPEQAHFVEEFHSRFPRYRERHREKAGITGWAQVNGLRGDTSISDRLRADLYYVENWSLWLDFKIVIRTIWQTVTRRSPNAY